MHQVVSVEANVLLTVATDALHNNQPWSLGTLDNTPHLCNTPYTSQQVPYFVALSHDLGSRTFSYPVLWHLLTKQSRPLCGKLRVYTYCTHHSQFLNPTDRLSEAKCHRYFFTSKAYLERTPLTSLLSYLFPILATISLPLCVEKRDRGLGFLIAYKLQKERKTEKLHCTNIRIYIIFKSSQISDSRNKIFTYIMQFFFLIFPYPCFY